MLLIDLNGIDFLMYVSSYNTYVSTNSSEKTQRNQTQNTKESSSNFSSKLSLSTPQKSLSQHTQQLPVNYISNYKSLNNQQRLQEDFNKNTQTKKFTKIATMQSAKNAYSENSVLFASLRVPKITLSQTPTVDKKLSLKAQEAQKNALKHTMVNTYIANENYYKITA
jgi:hypothetical protein